MFRTKNLESLIPLILRLPIEQHVDVDLSGTEISMQASGERTYEIMKLFPEARKWNKEFTECGWWEYTSAIPGGPKLKIYADRVGPRTCKKIVEQITQVVHVPACEAHDETRTLEKIRWECEPEEDEA